MSKRREHSILRFALFCFFVLNLRSDPVLDFKMFCDAMVYMLQEGKYKHASVQYKRIVSWLEHESGLSEEDDKKAKALQLAAHLNLAMCFLKLQEPNKALEHCDKVSGNCSLS